MIIVLTSVVSSFAEIYLSTYLSADTFQILSADGKEILANPPVALRLIVSTEIVAFFIGLPLLSTILILYELFALITGTL